MTAITYDQKMNLLSGLAMLLQSCEKEAELFDVAYWYLPQIFPNLPGRIFLETDEAHTLSLAFSWPKSDSRSLGPEKDHCPAFVKGAAMDGGQAAAPQCLACNGAVYCLAFRQARASFGVFSLGAPGTPPLSAPEKGMACITAEYLSLAISNLRMKEELRQLAIKDPLTKLYNRRYMDDVIPREIKRARRSGTSPGIIMADLDHFKRINDRFGHPAGDEVLRHVANALMSGIRAEDIACRFGGEEFLILMPTGSPADHVKRADDLRHRIQAMQLSWQGRDLGPVTASFGVASFPDHGRTWPDMLRAADQALYQAKQGGRNQVGGTESLSVSDNK